jgi:hypothetical protein
MTKFRQVLLRQTLVKIISENFDAQINIRMWAPNFGNTIEEKAMTDYR